ncbi:MAG: PSD1 and planctomycete cytochrome C domain-containing protein [Acidobacteriota bacterium]
MLLTMLPARLLRRPASWMVTLVLLMISPAGHLGEEDSSSLTSPDSVEFFERNVRPVLIRNCYSCHSVAQQFGGLRVDSRERLLRGGNSGPAVIPGQADGSLLIRAVKHIGIQMPLGGKLADREIEALVHWVNQGAVWPQSNTEEALGPGDPGFYEKILKDHWAFQPVREPVVPAVANPDWSQQPIDRFILAALERKKLKPSPPPDRVALARRLSFVLTGLPPTPLEVDLFVRDRSASAYERLVDRLLQSPHYGEHQARHWMDVVRFGETFGNDWNYELHGAWIYRDYLIRAFNRDVPYDQLIREHVAGDLLEQPRTNPSLRLNESVIGTAFFRLGEQGHDDCVDFRAVRTDVVDNQIDVLGKAFLGLTVACARCHDHKLDPIPTVDYYALYGLLTSSRMTMRAADLPGINQRFKEQLAELKPAIRSELAAKWSEEADQIVRFLNAANRSWKEEPPIEGDLQQLSVDRIQNWLSLLTRHRVNLDDPLYPWIELAKVRDFPAAWQKLATRYREEAQSAVRYNREHFVSFGNFRNGFEGWHPEGSGLREGRSPSGDFAVSPKGPQAVTGIYPAGIYTHTISERLNGALRSPLVPKDKKFVSIQVLGGHLAARRTILDNCMLSEDYELLNPEAFTWLKMPSRCEQKEMPFYLELVTKTDNPRLPDRPDRMKNIKSEEMDSPYSFFGIRRAVLHDEDAAPRDELTHMRRFFQDPAPEDLAALGMRYVTVLKQALAGWAGSRADDDDARWIHWFVQNGLLTNSKDLSPNLAELIEEYRAVDARLTAPRVFHGMTDLDPGYNVPVWISGDPKNPGEEAPRGFLRFLMGEAGTVRGAGSGRREAAELIASADNPLTARVLVNRLWQQAFGRGLVATTDNFGRYGEAPSHPELLDYLAGRFTRGGWSIKKLLRELILSQTFQQSSQFCPSASGVDPDNRLLHRYPVRRLEAESIRDSILFASGRLDRTLYGPSIHPYRSEPKEYRKLFSGPLDGNGRRSIYLKVTRHEGPRFLEVFDFPAPMVPRGTRDNTNVPPQALALMNDSFVLDQAEYWANQLIRRQAPSAEERIEFMFRTALGRPPEPAERDRFCNLVAELGRLRQVEKSKLLSDVLVWKDVAHSLFLLKEFVYIR